MHDEASTTRMCLLLAAMVRNGLLDAIPMRMVSKGKQACPLQLPWDAVEPTTSVICVLPWDCVHKVLSRSHSDEVFSASLNTSSLWDRCLCFVLGSYTAAGTLDLSSLGHLDQGNNGTFMGYFRRQWRELQVVHIEVLVVGPSLFDMFDGHHKSFRPQASASSLSLFISWELRVSELSLIHI